jgi:phage FluMu protein Com
MNGRVLHCKYPDCQKLIAKNVNLVAGSSLEIKCAHCGRLNCLCASNDDIKIIAEKEIIFLKI